MPLEDAPFLCQTASQEHARAMRICLVTPAFPLSEADYRAAFCLDFARALARHGHHVWIHTPDRKGTKEDLGVNVHWFKWSGGHQAVARTRFWHPSDVRDLLTLLHRGSTSLVELIQRERIEHVLALWTIPSGWFAQRARRKTQAPYSVWALGSDIWKYSRLVGFGRVTRSVLRGANHAFADGFSLAQDVQQLSGRGCTFLPTSRSLPAPALDGSKGEDDGRRRRFLFVGRFDHVKGVDLLAPAVCQLVQRDMRLALRIAGEGPYRQSLEEQIATLGLRTQVRVEPALGRQELADALAWADGLVIPSRMESIPVVLSDAVQGLVPVLVSDVGDMGRLVREYGVGVAYAPDNIDALAHALETFDRTSDVYPVRMPELMELLSIERAAEVFLKAVEG